MFKLKVLQFRVDYVSGWLLFSYNVRAASQVSIMYDCLSRLEMYTCNSYLVIIHDFSFGPCLSSHKYCGCLSFGTSSSLSCCDWRVCSASYWLRLKCVVALDSLVNACIVVPVTYSRALFKYTLSGCFISENILLLVSTKSEEHDSISVR